MTTCTLQGDPAPLWGYLARNLSISTTSHIQVLTGFDSANLCAIACTRELLMHSYSRVELDHKGFAAATVWCRLHITNMFSLYFQNNKQQNHHCCASSVLPSMQTHISIGAHICTIYARHNRTHQKQQRFGGIQACDCHASSVPTSDATRVATGLVI